jgi:kynurenine/2-aminoadipate aminotransferase
MDHPTTNIADHLSAEGRARQMAGLRKLVTAFAGVPGIIGLHGGLPPASAFPITEMSFTLRDGQKITVDDPVKVCTQWMSMTTNIGPSHALLSPDWT